MFKKIKNLQLNFLVFFIVANGVLLGLSFSQVSGSASIFFPAAGMTVGLYYVLKNRIAVGLFSAVFLTQFIYRIFAVEESILQSFTIAIFLLVMLFIEAVVFNFVMSRMEYKVDNAFSSTESNKFVLSIIASATFGAIIGTLTLYLHIDEGINILNTYLYFVIGDSMGIIVFGSLILNHYYHDNPIFDRKKSHIFQGIMFLVIYGALLFFIFGQIGHDFLTFGTFQVFIILMYVISGFVFSFRMIGFMNVMFLLAFNLLHYNSYAGDDILYEGIRISLFLIIASSIASIIKMILLERENSFNQMKSAKDSLEKIIFSTNDLVKIENSMPDEDQGFGREYLKNMFEIACEIYPKFDRASCNTIKGDYVEFVAVKEYDMKHLNSLKFLASEFVWKLTEPDIVTTTDYEKVLANDDKTEDFITKYGSLQKSIRFTVNIGENKYAGMSFDLYENSEYDFNEKDIDNFKSFQNLMNSYYKIGILNSEKDVLKDDIVLSLVRTLELYDLYTGGHSEEVADLCAEFGKYLGLPNEEIRELYWAGIVHDIGKIGLPADVLNMSRRLTDDEFEQVKKHPENGHRILSRSQSLSKIADVVLHHHEWWNGKGYPEGLKGESIPYHSRILHICDAVDAMAKDRVYRKALTEEKIISELERGKGQQFNPEIAVKMIEFIKIRKLDEII
jgi:HD-GYP domain-containing protein (c-di-GMP phosphodiesterase class II)/integral membrane sensor domain MASE1